MGIITSSFFVLEKYFFSKDGKPFFGYARFFQSKSGSGTTQSTEVQKNASF